MRAVVCGSFRRSPEVLRGDYRELQLAGCEVTSPTTTAFVSEREGFVFGHDETEREPGDIEDGHLAAIETADLIWLHAPGGYLGPSAAWELGKAQALDVPVYAREELRELGLKHLVHTVPSPAAAVGAARARWWLHVSAEDLSRTLRLDDLHVDSPPTLAG